MKVFSLLVATSESQNQVKSGLLLDVVIGQSSSVLQLLTSEDESLLIWRDSFLVLDLSLDVLNRVRRLDIESDSLSGQSLDENLHTTSESQNQVKSGLLLDVVVSKGSAVLELLTSEDESLLIWRDSFLVLDLGLDIFDAVRRLDVEGDGLSSQGLDEDLHTTSESEDKVKSGFLLDVVVSQSSSVFQLLSGEDESLLIWRDALLVLDLGLNVLDAVGWFDVEGNSLSCKCLNEDLHVDCFV